MDAIFYKNGVIRPAVAVVKSLASALAIGSGAAVGREGPIIQIGSALGSTLGQRIRMSAGQRIVLIAAGAGSGIAATFNTPIGGVLFATELMLPEVSVDTFLPVALATGTATHVGRLFFGTAPAFTIPADLMLSSSRPAMVSTLLLYAALGVLVGVAAALFIHGLHLAEDLFDRIGGAYRRHALGMLMIGAALYVFYAAAGHYYIEGVGYATIQAVLARHLDGAGFLLLLFVAKLAATSISLGSGSSGGVFSPSLFMGTALGAGFAAVARAIDPGADISLPAFAMVGMGAMVGSGTGAAMTAVAMIFEMTRDYDIVLPMIIAVAVALGTRRLLSAETLYSGKLAKRGHPVPKAMHANMFLVRNVAELMEADFLVLDAAAPVASLRGRGSARHAVLVERDRVVGVLPIDAALGRAAGRDEAAVALSSLATDRFVVVDDGKAVFDAIDRMEHGRAAIAVVIGRDRGPVGLLTSELIADAVGASIRLYPR
jgi:CIC family chloride channel protein